MRAPPADRNSTNVIRLRSKKVGEDWTWHKLSDVVDQLLRRWGQR